MKLVALAVAILVVSAAASADSLKATANKMDSKASAALGRKDFKTFNALVKACVTPDFKYIEQGAKGKPMTVDQMLANVKLGVGQLTKISSASAKTLSCKEHGNTGTTTSEHSVSGVIVGPDKKTHHMTAVGTSRDTWVKVGGAWKMSVMTWTGNKITMDGKPFNPMPAPTARAAK